MLEWLRRAFDRPWRVCATAFCFVTFGLGGLALRLLAFPLLRIAVASAQRRETLARRMIHESFRLFIGLMCACGIMRLEVRGAERLQRRSLLVLANHPTLIDVVILISLVRNADCIVKGSLLRNPFTRGPVSCAGFICNDDGPGLIDAAIASVRRGSALIIFPEGTRTRPETPTLHLQRGAANIAVRGALAVTPVVIRCTPPFLTKGAKWWRVPKRAASIVVEVRDDLPVDAFIDSAPSPATAARNLTRHLSEYFMKELARADARI
jgi:1-acyl-sn-glycerol-3-phosphate acyltransferase